MHLIINIIKQLDLNTLGLSWKYNSSLKTYFLVSHDNITVSKIWKKVDASGYGVCTGNNVKILREAKQSCINHVKSQLIDKLIDLNNQMIENPEIEYFNVTGFEYRSINLVLSKAIETLFHENLSAQSSIALILRGQNNRIGNALLAFDVQRTMFSILEISANHKYVEKDAYLLNTRSLNIHISTDKLDSTCLESELSFGQDGKQLIPLSSLTDKSLSNSVKIAIDSIVCFAQSKCAA